MTPPSPLHQNGPPQRGEKRKGAEGEPPPPPPTKRGGRKTRTASTKYQSKSKQLSIREMVTYMNSMKKNVNKEGTEGCINEMEDQVISEWPQSRKSNTQNPGPPQL